MASLLARRCGLAEMKLPGLVANLYDDEQRQNQRKNRHESQRHHDGGSQRRFSDFGFRFLHFRETGDKGDPCPRFGLSSLHCHVVTKNGD